MRCTRPNCRTATARPMSGSPSWRTARVGSWSPRIGTFATGTCWRGRRGGSWSSRRAISPRGTSGAVRHAPRRDRRCVRRGRLRRAGAGRTARAPAPRGRPVGLSSGAVLATTADDDARPTPADPRDVHARRPRGLLTGRFAISEEQIDCLATQLVAVVRVRHSALTCERCGAQHPRRRWGARRSCIAAREHAGGRHRYERHTQTRRVVRKEHAGLEHGRERRIIRVPVARRCGSRRTVATAWFRWS